MRVGLVIDFHQLADGGVGVFLRGGERLVAEQFLNGAEVGAVGKEMRGKGVAQRMWMQVPVDVRQAHVFLDDAADGALRQPAACVVEENSFRVRSGAAAGARASGLTQKLFAQRPVFVERFLGFGSVRDDALLVAFSPDAQNALFFLHVGEIEASEFTDAKSGGIEKFEKSAVAAEK